MIRSFLMMYLLTMTLFSQAFAQVRPPIPPVDVPVSTLCKKQCANNTQYLTYMTISSFSGARNCPERPTTQHSCAPYACEASGGSCKTVCASNADCSAGFACLNGQCGSISYYCADFSTSAGTDGSRFDCAPYACQSGQCLKRCATTNDCVAGSVCDVGAGLCVRVN